VPAGTLSSAFEQLREGDTFATEGRTVTEPDVVAFCAQTGDLHHPRGAGSARAASPSPPEPIVPGLLTLSYTFGLLPSDSGQAIALRGLSDVTFTRPVKIGDTVSVEGRVTALTPLEDGTGLVSMTLLTSNQHGKTVCRARTQMLWRRDVSMGPTTRRPER
jgi:3-hydroxybutyryl-CoA dehydratase